MGTLIIGIMAMGCLLLIIVGVGQAMAKSTQNQDEILDNIVCDNPHCYPVCSECQLKNSCNFKLKTA